MSKFRCFAAIEGNRPGQFHLTSLLVYVQKNVMVKSIHDKFNIIARELKTNILIDMQREQDILTFGLGPNGWKSPNRRQ